MRLFRLISLVVLCTTNSKDSYDSIYMLLYETPKTFFRTGTSTYICDDNENKVFNILVLLLTYSRPLQGTVSPSNQRSR